MEKRNWASNKYILVSLFFIFFVLRVAFLLNAPLRQDEKEFIEVAKIISFNSKNLNLMLEHPLVNHPLLAVYAIKAGVSIFGDNFIGYRFFSFLAGCFTLILLFFFIKRHKSNNLAAIAIVLLGLNEFHLGHSGLAVDDSLVIFFSLLAVYFFWESICRDKIWPIICCGITLGLGYFAKEVLIGLLMCFILYSLVHYQGRGVVRSKKILTLIVSFSLIISPYIFWVIKYGSNQRLFQKDFMLNFGLNLAGVNFYLIRLVGLIKGIDYRTLISWEYPAIGIILGIVLFFGSLYGVLKFKDELSRLMATVFLFFTLLVCVFKKAEFYWSEITIIPAVFLTSASVAYFKERIKYFHPLIILFTLYIAASCLIFVYNCRFLYPPNRYNTIVDYDFDLMIWYYEQGRIEKAKAEAEEALKVCPNEVRILNLLGIFQAKGGDFEKAKFYFQKALALKSNFTLAKFNLKMLTHVKDKPGINFYYLSNFCGN